jgi:C-terminal processing protease CtpA/Prc
VYVLTSAVSISAAENATEALQASGRARVVGEKTPRVLLQPKFFTLGNGFSLMWPIGGLSNREERSCRKGRRDA